MNRKIWALCIALVLGLFASVLVYGQLNRYRVALEKARKQMVQVVVATSDIAAYEVLGEEDVRIVMMPKGSVPFEEILSKEDIIGKASLVDLQRGDMILKNKISLDPEKLGMAFQLPEGALAIAIPVDEVIATGGFLRPGDYVDLIHVWRNDKNGPLVSRLLLSRIKLLALGQALGRKEEAKTKGQKPVPRTGVLQVSPKEATIVAWAQTQGSFLLALRPSADAIPSKAEIFKGFGKQDSQKDSSAGQQVMQDKSGSVAKPAVKSRGPWKIELIEPGHLEEVRVPIR